ncbi:helix-turn-helix transcriptional regulator [Kitasatospora sp. NPDC004723]|uniref:helix-turn-helix domain-containing protein n=1 Tax=Kitasatospora sp. NPDC004723 TaxID=3154288 RepID=UPI0033BF0636
MMLVGVQLKTLRGSLTLAAAARKAGFSAAKLSRLENGLQAPKPADIAKLLRAYRASPEVADAIGELVEYARAARSHWLYAFRDLVDGDVHRLIALETAAALLVTYEAKIVPGLIQTPAYYRALFEAELRPRQADELTRRIALRERRQELFFENPARCVFYLEESSLYRQVGSPRVMVEQLEQLYALTCRKGFGIRIIGMDHLFASSISSLTQLDFGSSALRELIYNETLTGGEYFTHGPDEPPARGQRCKLSEMEQYKEQLLRLMQISAGRLDSRFLILKALQHWQRRL